jgi:hypothetical protein
MAQTIRNTKDTQEQTTSINTRGTGFVFVDKLTKDPNGSQLPNDKSYSLWQNAWKSLVKMFQGNVAINAPHDILLNAGNEIHFTAHNKQETTTGGSAYYNKGQKVEIHGENNQEEDDRITKYHEHLDQINQASMDAIKNTPSEKVACPNCAQQHLVDDKSDNWAIIFDAIQSYTDMIPFLKLPLAAIEWLVMKIYVGLLGIVSNLSLSGGKGCGPGCQGGLKDGLAQKMAAGETATKNKMDELADQMNEITKNMGPDSSVVQPFKHGLTVVVGDPKHMSNKSPYITHDNIHHNYPMNIRPSNTHKNKLQVTTEGNCKVVTYHPPQPSPFGTLSLSVNSQFKLVTGNCGIDVLTVGEIAIKGGSVHINGSQGEASLTSSNLTTIGGGNVLISADNKSGDTGVCIDAKSTYVRGAFNVNGDTALLGSLTIDGNLNVNYLNCPTMKAPSTQASTDSYSTHHANWLGTSLALNSTNFALKTANFAFEPSLLMLPVGILTIALEIINLILIAIPIELMTTGIFLGVCAGFGGGVCSGLVWNFPHNHTRGPEEHEHEVPVPRGGYWKKSEGAGQMRATGNPSPTPVSTNTTYPCPAPRTWGGGCGGGGLYSRVRNQKYGINSDDAFNGGNYVTTTVNRNPDGSIYPPPDLTYRVVNDIGNSTIDKYGNITLAPALTGCD